MLESSNIRSGRLWRTLKERSMAASPRQTDETQQPTFVFKGTIKKLKGATMKEVPVNERTAVVTVDQIIEAPPDLAGYSGHDITVQLSGSQKVSVGQQMTFHTTSWMYGNSIAVRSLSQETVKTSHATLLGVSDDPVERRAQREQRKHFDVADLVVSGKVVAVRLPGDSVPGRKRASAEAHGPISEHDPKWREAVIEVNKVHKGAFKKKQVVVRFPASSDALWHGAPKFHAGQEGYFMLRRAKSEEPMKKGSKKQKGGVRVAGAAKDDTGAAQSSKALDPGDFQPYGEPGGIKTIIESKSFKLNN
jgi:hypothetical protein